MYAFEYAITMSAITTGVGYFAEGILFGSAGLIIIIEYYRSEAKSLKSKLKQELKEETEREELEDRFQLIETKIDILLKKLSSKSISDIKIYQTNDIITHA